jgi:hypothetical protein
MSIERGNHTKSCLIDRLLYAAALILTFYVNAWSVSIGIKDLIL